METGTCGCGKAASRHSTSLRADGHSKHDDWINEQLQPPGGIYERAVTFLYVYQVTRLLSVTRVTDAGDISDAINLQWRTLTGDLPGGREHNVDPATIGPVAN